VAQNRERAHRPLDIPVLTVSGAGCSVAMVADTMRLVAGDVEELVLPDCGHYPAEEAPDEMLAGLAAFLAPYTSRSG